ncbi:hypothetical protein Ppa06_68080 [Planomonospora parontospora subsp. parontospora]|uniref:Uncharacterized protein n=2 Tax=Planomonospora parontospora TaxID=58119 RepID=A0AA37BP56_9ACTN|nr:hypothetical protein [Planomonospora parontospora]GGK99587.1 hypothetical protein GCM10010126_68980 [Planomonospora parontospora]GII13010.1 hypothetical protein Ppa06_68080 [Planomonospora parontospora subsp. parontospora]
MNSALQSLDTSMVRILDGLMAAWVVLWLVVGVWVGQSLWELSRIGETIVSSGQAIDQSGSALQPIAELPLVGEAPGRLADQIRATGARIAVSGHELQVQMRRLSLLLGLAVALIPATTVLASYLPARLVRRRTAGSSGGSRKGE